jgi:ribosomal protein L14
LIVRTKKIFKRGNGVWFSFFDNAVILVGKKTKPLAKKVRGPVLLELVEKSPALGFISEDLL